jgi:hypothetical protein
VLGSPLALLAVLALSPAHGSTLQNPVVATSLGEYRSNPLGIDEDRPRLG